MKDWSALSGLQQQWLAEHMRIVAAADKMVAEICACSTRDRHWGRRLLELACTTAAKISAEYPLQLHPGALLVDVLERAAAGKELGEPADEIHEELPSVLQFKVLCAMKVRVPCSVLVPDHSH